MASSIYLFEDEGWKNLLPLTYLRPASELRCGIFTLRERIERVSESKTLRVLARNYVSTRYGIRETPAATRSPGTLRTVTLSEDAIYINGRLLELRKDDVFNLRRGEMILSNDEVVAFRPVSRPETEIPFADEFLRTQRKNSTVRETDSSLIKYPWDLVESNRAMIVHDFSLVSSSVAGFIDSGVKLHGKKSRLSLGENSRIEDFSILRLEDGPICIGKDVSIRGFTTIEGPCYVGNNSIVEGANLRASTFGPECRLSGEIEASIFQGYTNKRHEGFLGHSVVGEWVNLGAGTTNSDLKNNYKRVRVELGGEPRSTGISKVGCFIGDHTKTGIGTLINTGAVFGVFCNLLGGKLSPKYLPSFSWDTGDGFIEYEIDKALETAAIVMGRRGLELTAQIEEAIREISKATQAERLRSLG